MTTLETLIRASAINEERLKHALANGTDIRHIGVGIGRVLQWQAAAILFCRSLAACAARLPEDDPARVEAEKLLDADTFAERLAEVVTCES